MPDWRELQRVNLRRRGLERPRHAADKQVSFVCDAIVQCRFRSFAAKLTFATLFVRSFVCIGACVPKRERASSPSPRPGSAAPRPPSTSPMQQKQQLQQQPRARPQSAKPRLVGEHTAVKNASSALAKDAPRSKQNTGQEAAGGWQGSWEAHARLLKVPMSRFSQARTALLLTPQRGYVALLRHCRVLSTKSACSCAPVATARVHISTV
jgi:hypothetical protein